MRTYFTSIFEIFDYCTEENNFTFPIKGYEEHSKTYQSKFDALEFMFKFTMSNSAFLVSTLLFGHTNTVTPRQRKVINSLIVDTDDTHHYVDLFALFRLKEEERNRESLESFKGFFSLLRGQLESNTKTSFQFLYETNPMRVEPSIGISDSNKKDNCDKLTGQVNEYLAEHPIVKRWLDEIAPDLKRIGRWSWFYIPTETVMSFRELWAIEDEEVEAG
ncbi:hypothetical protein VCHA53O466_50234 [Vibrio chagasii]|nr:hypothetical protein VCHA53O466_50234 [Vibrio chagasii]